MMMSCRCGSIDTHTHFVPEHFPAYRGKHTDAPWPSTVPAQGCHRHVMVSGSIYRTVSDQCWSPTRRLADMDSQGTARQVLSPMPELLAYWLDADDGAMLSRFLNETVAGLVAQAPQRFSGLGAVPLQDVDRAIRELDYLCNELGLSGVELGSNVDGKPLGHPDFIPFFQAAAYWGAAVFIHPLRPAGLERVIGPALLEQVVAFPGELGLCAASLITGDVLEKASGLRVAFSHGGGALASILPRLQHGWHTFEALRNSCVEPAIAARKMFYDTLVYDDATINRLLDLFGDTQLMVGSDYPFSIMDFEAATRPGRLQVTEAVRRQLVEDNARRWLGENASDASPFPRTSHAEIPDSL
jgi:aminocarboxymuconate-semialdehyde decarboxylase